MGVLKPLLETINNEWKHNHDTSTGYAYVVGVTIHPSLAKAIQVSGEELPVEFDPNTYNSMEDGDFAILYVEVEEIDELVAFEYR